MLWLLWSHEFSKNKLRFVWQSILLVYTDTRSEGRMTVKVMMIREWLSKTIVPIDVQYESFRTGEVLSMCVEPVKVWHKNSDKEIMKFAMLDTCSQGTFRTTSLMEPLNISGIQRLINIKTLIGHQKETLYLVEGLSVSKAKVADGHPKWIKLPSAFSKKEISWTPVKLQLLGSSTNGITLKRYLRNLMTSVWIF